MQDTILLIGLRDAQTVGQCLQKAVPDSCIECCVTLSDAKTWLTSHTCSFFVLDIELGAHGIYDFLQWILDNCPTCGMFIGNQNDAYLAINGLNSGLIFAYKLRPVDAVCFVNELESRDQCHGGFEAEALQRRKGSRLWLQGVTE